MNTNKNLAQALRDAIGTVNDEELTYALGANYSFFFVNAIKYMSMIELMELKKLIDEAERARDPHVEGQMFMACTSMLEEDLNETKERHTRNPEKPMTAKNAVCLVASVLGMAVPAITLALEKEYRRTGEWQTAWARAEAESLSEMAGETDPQRN